MPRSTPAPSEWLPRAAAVVAAVTLLRLAFMALDRTDLFVDEAQYWFWGQDLAFGYYSKPPLIGWVIRAATDLAGSDAAFFVRLPAPLFHAASALVLAAISARLWGASAAVWTAALYITLPMVTVGSYMISTDTIMFPFLAAALGFWLVSLERGGAARWAGAAGAALGVAFLAKYAAGYYILCAGLAALLTWRGRTTWAAASAAALAFLVVISPNVLWNLANGLSTVEHTLDNADWVRDPGARAGLNLAGLAEFVASQFAVFGPVTFGALLWLGLRRGAGDGRRALLLVFSLPILALVCVQATLSHAYANWGVAAYAAGLVAVVPWLLERAAAWRVGTLVLHGAVALLIPVATAFGTGWSAGPDHRLLLERYLGRSEMSREILALAGRTGLPVVADDRDILADLFHTGRAAGIPIHARPEAGRASDHYVLTRSLPADTAGDVLFISKRSHLPEGCPESAPLARLAPETGAYRERPQTAWRVPAACLQPR